jgi:TrmH family RNA methyltransferase
MMIREISSFQNDWVKRFKLLQEKNRARKKEGVFIVEGLNEIKLCIKGGFQILELALCTDLISLNSLSEKIEFDASKISKLYSLSSAVFESLAYRGTVENALAIVAVPHKKMNIDDIDSEGLYFVAESVEKPGNLGAILRTADASNISALIVCDELVDIYHPNVIRNSLGCVFTVPIILCSSQKAIETFNSKKICIFSTFMDHSISLFEANLKGGVALVVGTEHQGLSDVWRNQGQNINIPMLGQVDSLNVSVASAVLMYEATRQRLN